MSAANGFAAIPTSYAGVNFRSRLEARWAAFFDLAGWRWEYEPFDLDGWIPDFRLMGVMPALVEVKPVDFANADNPIEAARVAAPKAFAFGDACKRIDEALNPPDEHGLPPRDHVEASFPHDHEALVLGLGPVERDNGWCRDHLLGVFAYEAWRWPDTALLFQGAVTQLDYAAETNLYTHRISGRHPEDGPGDWSPPPGPLPEFSVRNPLELWREAGNQVQWRPPERTPVHEAAHVFLQQYRAARAARRQHAPYIIHPFQRR